MITKEVFDTFILFRGTIDSFVEAEGSVDTFFRLPGHENRDRSAKAFKGSGLGDLNLTLELGLLFPVLSLDGCSTKAKQVNDFLVLEGKCGDGNLSVGYILVTKVWELLNALFNLSCDPGTETLAIRPASLAGSLLLGVPIISGLELPVGEESWVDIKLNSVVTRSDSLHIPFNVIVLLNLLDVVEVIDNKEGNEDGSATKQKSALLTTTDLSLRNQAANLHEHLG